jgi:hypothetical protein
MEPNIIEYHMDKVAVLVIRECSQIPNQDICWIVVGFLFIVSYQNHCPVSDVCAKGSDRMRSPPKWRLVYQARGLWRG